MMLAPNCLFRRTLAKQRTKKMEAATPTADAVSLLVDTLDAFGVGDTNVVKGRAEDFKNLRTREDLQKRRNKTLKKQKDSRRDLAQKARNLALEEAPLSDDVASEQEKEAEAPTVVSSEGDRGKAKRKRGEVEAEPPPFSGKRCIFVLYVAAIVLSNLVFEVKFYCQTTQCR